MGQSVQKVQRPKSLPIKMPESACSVYMEAIDNESDMEPQFLSAVTSHNVGTALVRINECDVRFQLDSAADVNTICAKFVKKHQLLPSKQKL